MPRPTIVDPRGRNLNPAKVRSLTDTERAEASRVGDYLTRQPAALFTAGELLFLAQAAIQQGGIATPEQLQRMRHLEAQVRARIDRGWWLDPIGADKALDDLAPGPRPA